MESQSDAPPEIFIEPPSAWKALHLREVWQFRDLLLFLAWRDIKVRYKQTALGVAWAVLQPAMMMVVFAVFLGQLARGSTGSIPYPLFVYIGLLPWMFFSTAVANASNSVLDSERMISKVYFPRLVIPFASCLAALVDFCVSFLFLLPMLIYYRVTPTLAWLVLPMMALVTLVTAMGVGTLLSALNVKYRDFRYVVPFLMQLWMFATPTIYMQPLNPWEIDATKATVPTFVHYLMLANPMAGIVTFFKALALDLELPWIALVSSLAVAGGSFLVGCLYFRQVEDSFADII